MLELFITDLHRYKLNISILVIGFISISVFGNIVYANSNETNSSLIEDRVAVLPDIEINNVVTSHYNIKPKQIQDPVYIPSTAFDRLTENEINQIALVIEHEVGAFSARYKTLITEVIYNRYISDRFPNTITEIIAQQGQFFEIEDWHYEEYEITKETLNIVKEVFSKENPSHDATYYYNPVYSTYEACLWFEGDTTEFVFEYGEYKWGEQWNTRFFKEKDDNYELE